VENNSTLPNPKISLRLDWLPLAGITLLAALLRFFRLGQWSFWIDEVFVLTGQEDGFTFNFLRQSLASDLIRLATRLLGTSEWSARLVPAALGVLTIPILYFPIRKIWGRNTALMSCLLIGISTWHLYWSQNARFYILLLLFYTLGLLAFHLGLEADQPWFFAAALLFFGLAVRERLLALFLLPVVLAYLAAIWLLGFERPPGWRWRNLAIFFGPGLIAGLIFARPYLADLPGWLAGFQRINNTPAWLAAGTFYYVGLPIVCLAAAGAIYRLSQKNRATLLLALSAGLPLLILMGLSLFQYTANRYIFITLVGWIILASLAWQDLWTHTSGRTRLLTAGVIILVVVSSASDDFFYFQTQNGNRDDWKAAFAYIQANQKPGDLVLTSNREIGDYYLQTRTYAYGWQETALLLSGNERLWLVEDLTMDELHPQIQAWMLANARLMAVFDVHVYARNFKMRVYFYDPAR
jgi:4-amino-4-deoxy-L-arabinose transferase-like glycosyltransferase